jgi:hypothetical protein
LATRGEQEHVSRGQPEAIGEILRKVDESLQSQLTTTQKKAAELMARILDPLQVDAILERSAGTVSAWVSSSTFLDCVAERRYFNERYDTPSSDFGRALSAKQRAVARALTLDGSSQVAAAATAGVDSRTIRNWLHQPAFVSYQDQLRREDEEAERARYTDERLEFQRRLRDAESKALEAATKAIENGDLKVALELLRHRK